MLALTGVPQVTEGEHKGLQGMQTGDARSGCSPALGVTGLCLTSTGRAAKAHWHLDATKQMVEFATFRVEPADSSPEGVQRWLAVFKDANEAMVRSVRARWGPCACDHAVLSTRLPLQECLL